MNIKIIDSWLRDYLKTEATPKIIGQILSETSVSVERLEKTADDYIYDIEVTTNRPDLMSVIGIAREASAVLKSNGIGASFTPLKLQTPQAPKTKFIEINNDSNLVNRICAVVMEVKIKNSPDYLKMRLENSDIRSLNNLIDITNYVMRTVGHPSHVFDFDRLSAKSLTIKEAEKGKKIKTLDNKEHTLLGGEIVAVNDNNEIVDLLGIMGLENSVVNKDTKRILFFIDNNEKNHIRRASMSLGIRTEAAVLNEKGLDSELSFEALLYGIKLYEQLADGKILSDIIDIYPNKPKEKTVTVSQEKINKIIGVEITIKKSSEILNGLGFENSVQNNNIKVKVPSIRADDVQQEEDIIEEIARVYGYGNIPSQIPPLSSNQTPHPFINEFYWEKRAREALKYWGYTETYTYSMVSEDLLEAPASESVEIQNPLSEEFVYMRQTLVPSLLKVVAENKKRKEIKIFELSKVYFKKEHDLPNENLMLAGVVKKPEVSFYQVKGLVEQLLTDFGIRGIIFKNSEKGGLGASLYIEKEYLGEIEVLNTDLIDFEINFETILKYATLKKEYRPLSKYPPVIEDISVITEDGIKTEELMQDIKSQSPLIVDIYLFDSFQNSRSFRITYQDPEKNLTTEEISSVRKKIISSLENKFEATIK